MANELNDFYVYGKGRVAKGKIGQVPKKIYDRQEQVPTNYCRITKENKLYLGKEGSNTLEIYNATTESLKENQHTGAPDRIPYSMNIKNKYILSCRFSKEDQFPLWKKNSTTLVLLDQMGKKIIKEYPQIAVPNFTLLHYCCSRTFDKIYGYSSDGNEGALVILLVDRREYNPSQPIQIRIRMPAEWVGIEVTTSSDLLVACIKSNPTQTSSGFLKMTAFDMSQNNLKLRMKSLVVKDPELMEPSLMRKVKGYDIFLVASLSNIMITGFDGSEFYALDKISNIYESKITGFDMFQNYMIPLSPGSASTLKLIQFNEDSYNSLARKEESKLDNSSIRNSSLKDNVYSKAKPKLIQVPLISKKYGLNIAGSKKINVSQDGSRIFISGYGGLHYLERVSSGVDPIVKQTIPQNRMCCA